MSCKYVILLGIKISAQLPSVYLIFFRDFDKMEDWDLGILRKNSTFYSRFTVQIRQIDMSKCLISISFWRLIVESGLFFYISHILFGSDPSADNRSGRQSRHSRRRQGTVLCLLPGREVCKLSGFFVIFQYFRFYL